MPHPLEPIELDTITPAPPSPVQLAVQKNPFDTPAKTPASSVLEQGAAETAASSIRTMDLLEAAGGTEQQQLPPVDRGRGAWGFVAAAAILDYATVLVYLQSHEPWSHYSLSALSAVGSVQLGVQFLLPIFATLVFRRYSDYVKRILWGAALVNCSSMLLSSWSTQVWHLITLQGIVVGASGSIMYTPVLLWLNEWFIERRGLAGGIIFAGAGIGGLVFPFVISGLLARVGFAWMIRVWVAITAVVFSLAVYLIKPRVPPARMRKAERGPWLSTDGAFLKNPLLLLMCFVSFTSSLSTFPVSLYLATFASNLTPSSFSADIVPAVYNAAASLGCAATGFLSDRNYPLACTLCGALGAVIALSAWGLADSLAKTYGFAVLFGFTTQIVAAWGNNALDVSGGSPHVASLVFGILSLMRGAASIMMPFVADGLYHPEESKEDWGRFGFYRMIIFVGVAAIVSAGGSVALGFMRRKLVKDNKLRPQR
ncbi:hypothetical protein JCM8097_006139 [Rhodosporidiobolus ruineniae]